MLLRGTACPSWLGVTVNPADARCQGETGRRGLGRRAATRRRLAPPVRQRQCGRLHL